MLRGHGVEPISIRKPGVVIRDAEMGDFQRVKRYLEEFSALHIAKEPKLLNPKKNTYRENRDYYASALRNEDSRFLVAEVDGKVAGYIKLDFEVIPGTFRDNEILYVDSIYVGREFRRNGVAKSLLSSAEDIARGRGIKRVQMCVYAFNSGMQSLLRDMGYDSPYATWNKRV
jgi:ribosomal protein S18 acetylase RimI-like enzyme